jgi:hypothetical protein
LVFAAARWLGAPVGPFTVFREWLLAHWDEVRTEVSNRRTQTNEPRRCAVLLPLLASLPQPLALLEVGAAAGLCLLPDRYGYRYDNGVRLDPDTGPSPLLLTCATTGPVPIPTRLPKITWRAGIDLNPLDVNSDEDTGWLRCFVWPGQDTRRDILETALRIARPAPPRILRGDLNAALPDLARQAPNDATLVIFHSAVLTYLTDAQRRAFADTVSRLPGHWISYEGPSVTASGIYQPLPPSPAPTFFLAAQGRPVASADGYGQTLNWFDP